MSLGKKELLAENVKLKAQINQLNYENQQLREMLEKKTKVKLDDDEYDDDDKSEEDDLLDEYDLGLGSVEVGSSLVIPPIPMKTNEVFLKTVLVFPVS